MSDEEPSNGLSGWAGITLGRMWAEHERSTDETLAWFAKRHRQGASLADFQAANQALFAQNQALAAENLRLREMLAAYEYNYNNLDAWADRAKARLEELVKKRS
jgi:hypothetical protein